MVINQNIISKTPIFFFTIFLCKIQYRAYKMLEDNYEEHVDVALRSSTSSKSLEHSF